MILNNLNKKINSFKEHWNSWSFFQQILIIAAIASILSFLLSVFFDPSLSPVTKKQPKPQEITKEKNTKNYLDSKTWRRSLVNAPDGMPAYLIDGEKYLEQQFDMPGDFLPGMYMLLAARVYYEEFVPQSDLTGLPHIWMESPVDHGKNEMIESRYCNANHIRNRDWGVIWCLYRTTNESSNFYFRVGLAARKDEGTNNDRTALVDDPLVAFFSTKDDAEKYLAHYTSSDARTWRTGVPGKIF